MGPLWHKLDTLPTQTFFIVPSIAEIVNFNRYDMVVCDSRTEYIGLTSKMWHTIFSYHKNKTTELLKK